MIYEVQRSARWGQAKTKAEEKIKKRILLKQILDKVDGPLAFDFDKAPHLDYCILQEDWLL